MDIHSIITNARKMPLVKVRSKEIVPLLNSTYKIMTDKFNVMHPKIINDIYLIQ